MVMNVDFIVTVFDCDIAYFSNEKPVLGYTKDSALVLYIQPA